jgi:hypothetical protein
MQLILVALALKDSRLVFSFVFGFVSEIHRAIRRITCKYGITEYAAKDGIGSVKHHRTRSFCPSACMHEPNDSLDIPDFLGMSQRFAVLYN